MVRNESCCFQVYNTTPTYYTHQLFGLESVFENINITPFSWLWLSTQHFGL